LKKSVRLNPEAVSRLVVHCSRDLLFVLVSRAL
jgi:hypothetical protein